MTLLRRTFLHLFAGVAAMPLSRFAQAQVSPATSQSVRVATGLLATWQSTAWFGAEAGIFKNRGIDLTLPAIAVGGPEAAAGLVRGDWEFAHTGTVPVAEEVLKGHDIVILATPTSDFPKSFVITRKEITQLAQLDGKKVGVLTETGQTSVGARITVEKAGATATYMPLIKFDRILCGVGRRRDRCRRIADRSALFRSSSIRLECLPHRCIRYSVDIRYYTEVDRLQPTACDERHARLRRDDPFVQDAARHRGAAATALRKARRSKGG